MEREEEDSRGQDRNERVQCRIERMRRQIDSALDEGVLQLGEERNESTRFAASIIVHVTWSGTLPRSCGTHLEIGSPDIYDEEVALHVFLLLHHFSKSVDRDGREGCGRK